MPRAMYLARGIKTCLLRERESLSSDEASAYPASVAWAQRR